MQRFMYILDDGQYLRQFTFDIGARGMSLNNKVMLMQQLDDAGDLPPDRDTPADRDDL